MVHRTISLPIFVRKLFFLYFILLYYVRVYCKARNNAIAFLMRLYIPVNKNYIKKKDNVKLYSIHIIRIF